MTNALLYASLTRRPAAPAARPGHARRRPTSPTTARWADLLLRIVTLRRIGLTAATPATEAPDRLSVAHG
jgi:hypothetical protein